MPLTFSEIIPEVHGEVRYEITDILFNEKSAFQTVSVVQTPGFGKVLLIDNLVMLTEKDEFIYHEMIAHVPLFVHPNPESILVIGGGDGGTVRECLRHNSVKSVELVDIDELVTTASLLHFPNIAGKLKSDKRVSCFFQDGVEYLKGKKSIYDVIIVDSTDPISVGEGLFTREFYKNCFNALKADGILVNQSESPTWQQKAFSNSFKKLNDIFPNVHMYQAHIPTYPSGHWSFGFSSKKYHPIENFRKEDAQKLTEVMQYYNLKVHEAAFALPNFVLNLLK